VPSHISSCVTDLCAQSNIAKRADPRVDSNLDGQGKHSSGAGYGLANSGPNRMDDRATHVATGGVTGDNYATSGPTNNAGYGGNSTDGYNNSTTRKSVPTSGPHKSALLNKLDPRVDSDRDSSNTGQLILPGTASTRDQTKHHGATGTTEHDSKHTGTGQETTSGTGSNVNNYLNIPHTIPGEAHTTL